MNGAGLHLPNRDERILDAAEKLFYDRGFDGVGVDEIGAAAGVSGSAIYRHFHGKSEILAALFDRAIDALQVSVAGPRRDPTAELELLIRSFATFAAKNRQLAGIWEREHRSLTEPYQRPYQRRLRSYLARWTQCFEALYPESSGDELRAAIRAVQVLLLSDSTRPIMADHADPTTELLVAMAMHSLSALQGVPTP